MNILSTFWSVFYKTLSFVGLISLPIIADIIIKKFLSEYRFNLKVKKGRKFIKNPVFLQVLLPLGEEKSEQATVEILKTAHSILYTKHNLTRLPKKSFFSLEIVSLGPNIYFFIVLPASFQKAIEGQIYANYPNAEITPIDDYVDHVPKSLKPAFAQLKLKYSDIVPLKTSFEKNEEVDILGKIAGFLSKTATPEQFWLQISLSPESNKWWLRGLPSMRQTLFGKQEGRDKLTNKKLSQRLFRGTIRMACWSNEENEAWDKVKTITDILKDLDGENKLTKAFLWPFARKSFVKVYKSRAFSGTGQLFSPKEISMLYHFPSQKTQASTIASTTSKKASPPDTLPVKDVSSKKEVSIFGETTFRNKLQKFGIKRADRGRHFYVIGKTGMGKSKLLELLMIADIRNGDGLTLIDPHGETAETIIKYIPKNRISDTIYFNLTDEEFPVALNILETTYDTQKKHIIATGFIAIFKKLFWSEWSPRMEQIARYTVLALLETENSSILAVPKLLTDKDFRQKVIEQIQDPIVKNFWTQEFMSWSDRFASESIVPLLNKVGQFLSNPVIRNCVGQTQNVVDFEKILNGGKIFIANLSKGQLGEENSALLGSMVITKIQEAALARAKIPEKERSDHYLYIDEFQNFATSAFNTLLSEARKYHLNLTLAHQFVGQLESEIQKSIFGNVSSIASFRVGGEDSVILEKEFKPIFSAHDFLNLNFREMYLKLSIDGKTTRPFSAKTVDLSPPISDNSREIIDFSRKNFGKQKNVVENEINEIARGVQFKKATSGQFDEPLI